MAANDYYSSFNSAGRPPRNDDPLPDPPHPPSSSAPYPSVSPVTSPFDDNAYPNYPMANKPGQTSYSDTAYHSQGGFYQHQQPSSDPFGDQNAIPLQSQSHSHSKMDSSPTRYDTDPEGRYPSHGHIPKRKKKGWFSGRVTWVVYILTAVQCSVFVGELIRNAVLTKSPIAIKPQFNIMIGPSPYVLINMGARYPPCMHNIRDLTDLKQKDPEITEPLKMACPNATTNEFSCSLSELCGFGGVPEQPVDKTFRDRSNEPNQWWRFIVPIFLHAGLIHIAFNMLLQWTLGRDMEKEIGSLRFILVYFSSGIFGFVLGGNYAAQGIASTGASGSLFGILALTLLDLLYNWQTRRSPLKDLLFLLLDIAIAFVLGLLPGLDNFAHIGGFIMGLVLGVCLMHSPPILRERIGVDEPPYSTVDNPPLVSEGSSTVKKLTTKPIGFFKGRKPLWWVWWLFRAGCLLAVLIGFILLLKNFYEWRNECSWCHRLTCLPIKDWCDIGSLKLTSVNGTSSAPAPTSTASLTPQRRAFYAAGSVPAMATPAF